MGMKNLGYAFIYANGVTLRAWWTLDDITVHLWRRRIFEILVCKNWDFINVVLFKHM